MALVTGDKGNDSFGKKPSRQNEQRDGRSTGMAANYSPQCQGWLDLGPSGPAGKKKG